MRVMAKLLVRRQDMTAQTTTQLSDLIRFSDAVWNEVPNEPGVYVIWDQDEVVYMGMAGRNGKGGIRNRLRDHASGQIVNMFAQYLFLARVQFLGQDRINHPRDAKQACRDYISGRCAFRYATTPQDAARWIKLRGVVPDRGDNTWRDCRAALHSGKLHRERALREDRRCGD
jgi:hypothetical protein